MNNILIPTDFTNASLRLAEQALQNTKSKQVNIILFHAFELSSYAMDMIRISLKEPYHDLLTDGFRQACKQLKDEYPKAIGKISFRHMYGDTAAVFRNFVDANDIDMIFCPDDYVYKKAHERSVDPRPLFRKSGIPVIRDTNAIKREVIYSPVTLVPKELAIN